MEIPERKRVPKEILSETVVTNLEPAPGQFRILKRIIDEGNGTVRTQFVWSRGKFVIVPAVDRNGNLVFKREFKYGQMESFLTFAAGGVKVGETYSTAAERELLHEFGMKASLVVPFPELANSPDKSTELHQIVFALNTVDVAGVRREEGEIVRIPITDVENRILEIKIAIQRLAVYEMLRYLYRMKIV